MSESLQGLQLRDIWTTFLHISGASITSTTPQRVYDGAGNGTTLYLTTTGAKVDNLQVGQITFPANAGNINEIPVLTTTTKVEFKSIAAVLSAAAPLVNGDFSSPSILVRNGIVSSVLATGGSTKTFILPNRLTNSPVPTTLAVVGAITWTNPTSSDTAYVLQKVNTPQGALSNLTIYKLSYSTGAWVITNQY